MPKRPWQAVDLAVIGLGAALTMFFVGAAVVLAVKGSAPTAFWSAGGAVGGGLLGVLAQPPAGRLSRNQVAARVAGDLTHTAAVQAAKQAADEAPTDQKEAADGAVRAVSNRGIGLLARVNASVSKLTTPVDVAHESVDIAAAAHQDQLQGAADRLQAAKSSLEHAQDTESPDKEAAVAAARAAVAAASVSQVVLKAAATAASQAKPSAADRAVTAAVTASPSGTPKTAVWMLLLVFLILLGAAVVLAGGAVTPPKAFGNASLDNLIKTIVALASAAGSGLIGLFAPSPSTGGSAGTAAT
jgi:hypothetical protein